MNKIIAIVTLVAFIFSNSLYAADKTLRPTLSSNGMIDEYNKIVLSSNQKIIRDFVDLANAESDTSTKISRLERLHFLLRLLPLASDVKKETGNDIRVLNVFAEITEKDVKSDADYLRTLSETVDAAEWQYLYNAMAGAYLEANDTWRAISALVDS